MSKMKIFIVITLLLVVAITGCMTKDEASVPTPTSTPDPTPTPTPSIFSTIHTETVQDMVILKFHDDEQNVTCYVCMEEKEWKSFEGGYGIGVGVGMSCIPDWQLTSPQMSSDCNCS